MSGSLSERGEVNVVVDSPRLEILKGNFEEIGNESSKIPLIAPIESERLSSES